MPWAFTLDEKYAWLSSGLSAFCATASTVGLQAVLVPEARQGSEGGSRKQRSARWLVSNVWAAMVLKRARTLEGKNPSWGYLGVCGRILQKNVKGYRYNEICSLEVDGAA